MDSMNLAQDGDGGMSFDSFGDVVSGVASATGHSTRDGIFNLIGQGINILPQLFGPKQQPQPLPAPVYVDPNQVGAGLQVGVGGGGVNVGGGLQLNTTTLLIGGLALALFLRK